MSGSQLSMWDGGSPLKIDKPLRLIELFAGIGAQAKALERLGVPFEHYRICEFDKYAVMSYNAIHGTNFKTSDIRDLKGADLGIVETDKFTYILTYSFPCTDLSVAGKQAGMRRGGVLAVDFCGKSKGSFVNSPNFLRSCSWRTCRRSSERRTSRTLRSGSLSSIRSATQASGRC